MPVYGICYGNQIMAHALGGTVERAREPEIGWHHVVSDVPEVIPEGHGCSGTTTSSPCPRVRQSWRAARSARKRGAWAQLLHAVPP